MAKFTPVCQSISLTDKVAEQIRSAIIRGDYKPGDKLPSEPEFVELFQVSRTSVREAIKILAGQGLIEVKRGLGAFVLASEPQCSRELQQIIEEEKNNLIELFQIRKILEMETAALAAQKATPADIAKLKELVVAAVTVTKQKNPDLQQLNRINSLFHEALLETAGNRTLERVMRSLMKTMTEARAITIQLPGRYNGSVEGHKRILRAIEQGNAQKAKEEMKVHLETVEYIIEQMTAR